VRPWAPARPASASDFFDGEDSSDEDSTMRDFFFFLLGLNFLFFGLLSSGVVSAREELLFVRGGPGRSAAMAV